MKTIIPKVTASVAIIKGGKILIIKRAKNDVAFPGLWELPSGKKEPLEKIEKAAQREAKEETDLDVEIVDILGTFNFGIEREGAFFDVTQIVFLAKSDDKPVKISDEHDDHAWIRPAEIENYNLSDETKAVISKAFSRQNQ